MVGRGRASTAALNVKTISSAPADSFYGAMLLLFTTEKHLTSLYGFVYIVFCLSTPVHGGCHVNVVRGK